MRTLMTEIYPVEEGVNTKHEIELPNNISWELRFYCNNCDIEITETEIQSHKCKNEDDN